MDAVAARMSAAQFAEWQEFAGVEPFGAEEEWLRFGMVSAVVANSNPFRGGSSPAKPSDFIRKPPVDPELLAKLAKATAHANKLARAARPGAIRMKAPKRGSEACPSPSASPSSSAPKPIPSPAG